jgi:hypothetical protein
MMTAVFGKPETGGVVLSDQQRPVKREVSVRGYVVVEIQVDEWVDADEDMDDEEIKRAALEQADIGPGEIQRAHLTIEGDPSKKALLRAQREREQCLLAAWTAGEPIRA